jgi:tetratricopeptide (TPR) repeat protein
MLILRLGSGTIPQRLHCIVILSRKRTALAHYYLGFAYGMTGRKTDEINEYLAAARLGLDKWDLFLNLGLAYLGQDDGPNAIKALQTAVSLGQKHREAHFNLAIAYEKGNRLGEALQEIIVSLRVALEDPDEENMKGIMCAELGNLVCSQRMGAFGPSRARLRTRSSQSGDSERLTYVIGFDF